MKEKQSNQISMIETLKTTHSLQTVVVSIVLLLLLIYCLMYLPLFVYFLGGGGMCLSLFWYTLLCEISSYEGE